jgi:hypothetical protein
MYNEKIAFEKGYKVFNGIVYGPNSNIRKLNNRKGYLRFTITSGSRKDDTRKSLNVYVHRLVAFQKYKNQLYRKNILVRHKDNNSLNNLDENILIGSQYDNIMDIPSEKRIIKSIKAAEKHRVLTDEQINMLRKDRDSGLSFQKLSEKYNLSGKGHACYTYYHIFVTNK